VAIFQDMGSEKDEVKGVSVRINPRVHKRFGAFVKGLELPLQARFRGEEPTMEVITEVLWYWFTRLDTPRIVDFLTREYPLLEEFREADPLRGDVAKVNITADVGIRDRDVTPPKKGRKPKGKA
jgi:hypothetical protein